MISHLGWDRAGLQIAFFVWAALQSLDLAEPLSIQLRCTSGLLCRFIDKVSKSIPEVAKWNPLCNAMNGLANF